MNPRRSAPSPSSGVSVQIVFCLNSFPSKQRDGYSGSLRSAEFVRHHRAPHVFVQVAGQRLGSTTGDSGIGERVADTAKIYIEIFGPRRPVRAQQVENVQLVLDAAPDRKPGLTMGERWADGGAGCGLGEALLDFPIGSATGDIEQGRPDRIAEPPARRPEPRELLIDRCRRAVADCRASQVAAP